jgi:WD40 repeat protein
MMGLGDDQIMAENHINQIPVSIKPIKLKPDQYRQGAKNKQIDSMSVN